MSEKSELDLNSDVVLSDPESEALKETSRLSGKNVVVLGGSAVEEEEEALVRVLEAEKSKEGLESEAKDRDRVRGSGVELKEVNVDERKEEKMEDVSLKEGIEDKGTVLESSLGSAGCVNETPLSGMRAGPDMGSDKGVDLAGNEEGKEVSLQAEKEKEDLAEVERSAKEGLDKGVSVTSYSEAKVDETSHSQCLEALPPVSEVLEPKSVESTESGRELTDDIPVIDDDMKVDPDESLNQGDSKVSSDCETVPSDGLQNGALEVHLEAEPKGCGNGSDSIDIVIDLNPNKKTNKGALRDVKVKSAASKPGFNIGDLIWGKVRSHPWWPGQICDPSAASRKAKKYFKRDSYLIAYYGDNTFAWNEASQVKPFLENFCLMEKQGYTEDFHYAIDCVLEEVSRRVEFGLACHCLSEEVYEQIKSQIIVNAGIQEELSRRDGGDSSLTVASFKPAKLVEYIKELSQDPNGGANDKLEFAVAQSELLAFSRWKGYYQLPEFNMLGGLLENDADMVLSSENKHSNEVSWAADKESKDNDLNTDRAKTKMQKCSSLKRKLDSKDGSSPSKKEKSLTDLMVEKSPKTPVSRNASVSKATSKKRKARDVMSNNLPAKQTKSMAKEIENKPLPTKPSFRVGDSIRRVASQLNGSSPILKNGNNERKSPQLRNKSKEEKTSEVPKAEKKVEIDNSSAGKDPTKTNNSSGATSSLPSSEDDEQSLEDMFGGKSVKKSTKNGRKPNRPGVTDLPHQLGSTTESYWSQRIGRSIPEDQDQTSDFPLGTIDEKEKDENPALEPDSKQKTTNEDLETEADNSSDSKDDSSPTALILNFSDLDSVPSETNLNKIFSCYGSLNESQTEIFKKSNRAKVVFKKRSDAETAFSSAGKYSTFGPSLVSYRLKYLSSPPIKASPKKKRNKTDKASEEDNKQ